KRARPERKGRMNFFEPGDDRPHDKPVLQLKDVYFQYERKSELVLRGCDLDIYSGSVAALFGGNGSGKSTLLRIAAGLMAPQRGKVLYRGKPARKQRDDWLENVGYMAQNPM